MNDSLMTFDIQNFKLALEKFKSGIISNLIDVTKSSDPKPTSQHVASQLEISRQLEDVIQSFKPHFESTQFLNTLTSHFARIVKTPELVEGFLKIMKTLTKLGANDATKAKGIELMKEMSVYLTRKEPDITSVYRNGPKDQIQQWTRLTEFILNTASQLQNVDKNVLIHILNFLNFSLKENPQFFDNQLFGLPIILKSGINLNQFLQLSTEVEPVRLALLLIEADQQNKLKQVTQELLFQLNKDIKDIKQTVLKWEAILKPTSLKSTHENLEMKLINLNQGIGHISSSEKNSGLMIQALSFKEGVLDDSQLQLTLNLVDVGIKGSLLSTLAFPFGFHRLKIKARDKKGKENFATFLFDIFKSRNRQNSEPLEFDSKTSEVIESYNLPDMPLQPPLGGQLQFDLDAPMIWMSDYDSRETRVAPLHVNFQFLADIVDANHRFSATQFLTLSETKAACHFRNAVKNLNQKGIEGYHEYIQALDQLFFKMNETLDGQWDSFRKAKNFLRDEVLLYLMGKKEVNKKKNLLEKNNRGDVMASVYQTMGSLMLRCGEKAQALIQFADSVPIARNQPYFLKRMEDFFNGLRNSMSCQNFKAVEIDLPVLPPQNDSNENDCEFKSPLTEMFLKNYKVCSY